jgi:glycosyltransferase involved in cell wall biosynthesis
MRRPTDVTGASERRLERDSVSAIVIGRDEAAALRVLLPRLRAMRGIGEVIFCDGGSGDASSQIASEMGARVLIQSGGRGAQLRTGALGASGRVLWFLHADAWPDKIAARQILRACNDARGNAPGGRQVLGGNFRLAFVSRSPWARFFELVARVQRARGMYYGDSGLWVRREIYEALGGFSDWPLFEDLDFARRLEKHARSCGGRTRCLRPPLRASSRRFERAPWQVLRLWISMQRRFERGEDPQVLAREYHARK